MLVALSTFKDSFSRFVMLTLCCTLYNVNNFSNTTLLAHIANWTTH